MKFHRKIGDNTKIKACFTFGFILLFSVGTFSQKLSSIDSLKQAYRIGEYKDENEQFLILKALANVEEDLSKLLFYSEEMITLGNKIGSSEILLHGWMQKGNAFSRKGDLSEALLSYTEAIKTTDNKSNYNLGLVSIAMADVYSIMGNHDNAVHYYKKAITIHKENDSLKHWAIAVENLGNEYLIVSKPDSALLMFNLSGSEFKKLGHTEGIATNIGNKGIAYMMLGKNDLAMDEINHSIAMHEEMGNFYTLSYFLLYMSDLYVTLGDRGKAMEYAKKSLEVSKKYGLKDQISEAHLQLSKLYEQSGDLDHALSYFKNYTTFKDSVSNIAAVQQMANIRTDFEIAQKQIEVDLLNQQKRNQKIVVIATIIALVLICIVAIGLFKRNKYIEKTKKIIEEERNRSEKLLLNILPEQTAKELKEQGKVKAKKFDSVSVMFTDFKGFTRLSEGLNPEELVKSVDFYYSKFDEIIKSYGLEKIKTIGDAYMAAGGLPFPDENHAYKLVLAALEIAEFVEESKKNQLENEKRFDIRIGINTGPVVAGVVGTNKFAYDIWGDTVNIAARMESNSTAGKVNISKATYELIKDRFDCVYRGEIDAKNRGKLKMFFVNYPIKNAVPIA